MVLTNRAIEVTELNKVTEYYCKLYKACKYTAKHVQSTTQHTIARPPSYTSYSIYITYPYVLPYSLVQSCNASTNF